MGFKIMIYAAIALLPYFKSVTEAMNTLKKTGDVPVSKDLGPKDIFNACGLQDLFEFDKAAGISNI